MDGKGCGRDNVFVARLWKRSTYEEVYLHASDTVSAAPQGGERYLTFYNQTRPHQALDGQTPDQVYSENRTPRRQPRNQQPARHHLRNARNCPTNRSHLSRPGLLLKSRMSEFICALMRLA